MATPDQQASDLDRMIHRATAMYPPADITPAEYESLVVDVFRAAETPLVKYEVALHDVIEASDGSYDFDGTVRFSVAGMDFLVLIEAKRHNNPIKREVVQALQQKKLSVGAQKAVLVSTSPFQRGAVDFAATHGVALMTLTEGRFAIEVRSSQSQSQSQSQWPTREEALDRYGLPVFVAKALYPGERPGAMAIADVSTSHPDWLQHWLIDP